MTPTSPLQNTNQRVETLAGTPNHRNMNKKKKQARLRRFRLRQKVCYRKKIAGGESC